MSQTSHSLFAFTCRVSFHVLRFHMFDEDRNTGSLHHYSVCPYAPVAYAGSSPLNCELRCLRCECTPSACAV